MSQKARYDSSGLADGNKVHTSPARQRKCTLFMNIAKEEGMKMDDVKKEYDAFLRLDADASGFLSNQEFEDSIRLHCGLPPGQPLPAQLATHCFGSADLNNDGKLNFEEFVHWTSRHEFTEEWMVGDPHERRVRQFIREHGLCVADIDKVRTVFKKLDIDDSGSLDKDEFAMALCSLLNAKRREDIPESTLKRYWKEVDVDQDGSVSFEEFALWYFGVRGSASKSGI